MPNDDPMIKASKEPAKNAYGQDGSPLASSLTPGQTKSPIAGVSPPTAHVPGLADADQLSHRVKMDADGKPTALAPHSAIGHSCSVSSGSPGGEVPKSLSYGREGKR